MNQLTVSIPKAFSVRDEHEFSAHQHLLSRMHPKLKVTQIATGRHINGGHTVFWGLVHLDDQKLSEPLLKEALTEAGFDFYGSILLKV